ncbi:hypothetical protein M0802_010687 [Mischocyttarus mexicanus]|nr:hypothetical protein M0802_010687 [Mischocyttarus mexicanus]
MGYARMINLKKILLLICITSGLTLSANNETQTDGGTSNKLSSNLNNSNTLTTLIEKNVEPILPLTTIFPSINTKEHKAKDNSFVETEGGPISNLPSVKSSIFNEKVIDKNNSTSMTVNKVSVNNDNVSQAMTIEKDLPVLDRKRGYLTSDQTTFSNATIEHDNNDNNNNNNVNNSKIDDISTKVVDNVKQLNNTNSTVQRVLDTSDKKLNETVTSSTMPPMNKHKPNPKPTVTMGGGSADPNKPIPPSPTKGSPLGMPRKIDYIIPIAITIVALPILGIASFILYNRGKDCWDKRHYRRMDFLIDGMYND